MCPNPATLALLGEVKYARNSRENSLEKIVKDLVYYMNIPVESDKNWRYSYGLRIHYSSIGDSPRRLRLVTDYWRSDRFALICLQ